MAANSSGDARLMASDYSFCVNSLQDADFASPYSRRKRRTKLLERQRSQGMQTVSDGSKHFAIQEIDVAVSTPVQDISRPVSSVSTYSTSSTSPRIASRASSNSDLRYPATTWYASEQRSETPGSVSVHNAQELGQHSPTSKPVSFFHHRPPLRSSASLHAQYELEIAGTVSPPERQYSPWTPPLEHVNLSKPPPIASSYLESLPELDSLEIYELPAEIYHLPLKQSNSLSTLPTELPGSTPDERPSERRHTISDRTSASFECTKQYQAFSKPDAPLLRPNIEKRETYPPRSTHVYLPYSPIEPTDDTQKDNIQPYRSFESRFKPMSTSTQSTENKTRPRASPDNTPSINLSSSQGSVEIGEVGTQKHEHPPALLLGCTTDRQNTSKARKRRERMEAILGDELGF